MGAFRAAALLAVAAILICCRTGAGHSCTSCVESVMVKVPWGATAECLSRGDTTAAMTPGPLFNVKDGTVYVVDRVGGRLLIFDPRGGAVRRDLLPAIESAR